MALVPGHKNLTQLLKRFQDRALARTDISNFARDSKFKSISDALGEELLRDRQEMIAAFDANQFSKAPLAQLMELGEQWGAAPRKEATFATVTRSERNILWTVTGGGTFGSINGGADIVLTANTIVFTNPNSNEFGETIQYVTTTSVMLPGGSSLAYTPVRAVVSGNRSNVGAGVLQNHNFTNYTDAANNTLRVVNLFPILTGQDPETVDQYRARLANYYVTLLQNNETKVRLERLQVPGVVDIKVIENYYGIGSGAAVVLGAENLSTTALVEAVQKRLNSFKTPGLEAIAIPAVEVSFAFEIDLHLIRPLTTQEENRTSSNVRKALRDYLSSLQIGGTVDLTQALGTIQESAGTVLLQNRDDRSKLFRSVWISKSQSGGIPDERVKLIQNQYGLGEDEYASMGELTINFVV